MNAETEQPRIWQSHDPDFRWSIVADRRLGRLEVNIDPLPDPDQARAMAVAVRRWIDLATKDRWHAHLAPLAQFVDEPERGSRAAAADAQPNGTPKGTASRPSKRRSTRSCWTAKQGLRADQLELRCATRRA
jgi:hypothetical protein